MCDLYIQVIQSNNYDRLKFSCNLRSFFSSAHVLGFENKGAIFLEIDQYELKKEQHKRLLEQNVKQIFRFFIHFIY